MPYIDGLPDAPTVTGNDLVPVAQSSTGAPGTGITRSATLTQILQLGSGPITGPGSSVSGNLVAWNGTSGHVIADAGYTISTAMQPVVEAASVAAAAVAMEVLPLTGGTVSGPLTLTATGTAFTVNNNATISATLTVGFLVVAATEGAAGLITASGGVKFPDGNTQLQAFLGDFAPAFSGLVIQVTSGAAVTIAANSASLANSSNQSVIVRAVALTLATGTVGANGIDTGAPGANTWLNVFIINGTSGTAGLLSLSGTAPALPAGYTFFARFGAVRVNATPALEGTLQAGRRVQYLVGGANITALPMIASGASGSVTVPTWTAKAVTNFVPPTASAIRLVMFNDTTGTDTVMCAPNNSYGAANSSTNVPPLTMDTSSSSPKTLMGELLLESANIYYAATGGLTGLQCFGWEDNL